MFHLSYIMQREYNTNMNHGGCFRLWDKVDEGVLLFWSISLSLFFPISGFSWSGVPSEWIIVSDPCQQKKWGKWKLEVQFGRKKNRLLSWSNQTFFTKTKKCFSKKSKHENKLPSSEELVYTMLDVKGAFFGWKKCRENKLSHIWLICSSIQNVVFFHKRK